MCWAIDFFICIQSRGTDRTYEQHTAGSKDSVHQHTAHTMRPGFNKGGTSKASITWTVCVCVCVCVRESCEGSYCHSAGPLRSIQINSNKKTVGGENLQSFLSKEERSTTWTLNAASESKLAIMGWVMFDKKCHLLWRRCLVLSYFGWYYN